MLELHLPQEVLGELPSRKDEGKDKKRPHMNLMWRFIIVSQAYLKWTFLLSCQAQIYPMAALF